MYHSVNFPIIGISIDIAEAQIYESLLFSNVYLLTLHIR